MRMPIVNDDFGIWYFVIWDFLLLPGKSAQFFNETDDFFAEENEEENVGEDHHVEDGVIDTPGNVLTVLSSRISRGGTQCTLCGCGCGDEQEKGADK